jgi:hypothetical protein
MHGVRRLVLRVAVRNRYPSMSSAMPASIDIFVQEMIEVVVTGNVMLLAALRVQADPSASPCTK